MKMEFYKNVCMTIVTLVIASKIVEKVQQISDNTEEIEKLKKELTDLKGNKES